AFDAVGFSETKVLALTFKSCSCRIASCSVEAISADDEKKDCRAVATLPRAIKAAPAPEAIRPASTSSAAAPAHPRWVFETTPTPLAPRTSDGLLGRAPM